MAAVARLGDPITTGHPCDATATIAGQLQSKVFVNGIIAAVKGDPIAPHTILVGDICVPHSAVVNAGSSKVFCQGISIARVGDSADLGVIVSGSSNVFAGG